ncbi:hypothetical protein FRC10_006185 [Ceratobasidium sp. 414]|nr:hypothetical protein FRC10_006185 [Ceratobasidium sp. 414]
MWQMSGRDRARSELGPIPIVQSWDALNTSTAHEETVTKPPSPSAGDTEAAKPHKAVSAVTTFIKTFSNTHPSKADQPTAGSFPYFV